MPANRSRTMEWRRCLKQVHQRRGALDIAVARNYQDNGGDGRHLIWRVRLLEVTDREIIVEEPKTLGQVIHLRQGIELIAIMAIGQNRWMFTTANLGPTSHPANGSKTTHALRLAMPRSVQRCQRRSHYRVQTASLNLPDVEMWPLLDAKSVVIAERANELRFRADRDGQAGRTHGAGAEETMPEVGPKLTATLLNIGGGGVGLRVKPADAQVLTRHKLFWLRFSLPPELNTPICATGKLVHTSVDSTQHTYAGVAFDFSFNPNHQQHVVDQICRYISIQQQSQFEQREGDSK